MSGPFAAGQTALLSTERQQAILAALRQRGKVLVSEVSAALHVSVDTVRRDLRELEEAGLLQRVHGGAVPALATSTTFAVRLQEPTAAKEAIGRVAARLVRDGQVIVLDGGTTTLQIARHLPPNLQATVITNAVPIAAVLAEYPYLETFVVGGQLFRHSPVMVGPTAVREFQALRADLCFLGIRSLHAEHGARVAYRAEAEVKRAMVEASAEVVVVATAEKLGTISPYLAAPLRDLTSLVTESRIDEEHLAPYRAQGVAIIQADAR